MLTIRPGDEKDVASIASVVNAAFEVERPMRARGNRTSAENVRELLARGETIFVAEEEARIVGSVMVRVSGATGYFGMLAVDPARQHSGIGRALRERAEAFCKERGCTEMTLSTGDFRTELLPYYQRAGYKVMSIEPGPSEWGFGRSFQVVHMAKRL